MTVQLTGIFDPVVRLTGRIGLFVPPPKPIWTNLVAWWSLDEATGQTRIDQHGGYNLSDATGATPQVADGVVSAAAGVRTTGNHYLYSADQGLATNGESFAVAGWFRLLAANTSVMISRNNDPFNTLVGRDFEISLSNRSIASTLFYVRNTLFERSGALFYGIGTNTWHFFAARYEVMDASNARLSLRVDDIDDSAVVALTGAISATPQLRLGRRDGSFPTQTTGDLDEIAYWRGYVPTTEELDWLYNAGAGRSYADFAAEFGP